MGRTHFYSGLLLGWASLVYILKEDGIYQNECEEQQETRYSFHNDSFELEGECSTVCKGQDLKFNVTRAPRPLNIDLFLGNFCDINDNI